MWKLLNFKRDKRTILNLIKFPIIVCITIPIASLLIFLDWFNNWSDIINDKLPRWDPN